VTAALTGTFQLTRFIMRRDRIRISVWIVSIVALAAFTVAGIKDLFPTQAALDQVAAATQHNSAAIAFNGPDQGLNTVGGQVAFQFGAAGMVLVALMSLFMVGRLTRGEEEAGRFELVRSLPVGRHAPTVAAALSVGAMNVAVGALTAIVLLAEGLPVAGTLALSVSFLLIGFFFGAVALLAAQVTENTRAVYGATGVALGAAFILRAVGDIGDGTASWFSPIGIAQKSRPFAGETWWPLLLLAAAAAMLVTVAIVLVARRDLGSGMLVTRPGRPTASPLLGSPLGLAVRLQRGALVGWGAGVLVMGVAYGWIGPTVDAFVGQNKTLAELLAGSAGGSLTDAYFASSFRILGLLVTGFAIQSALRLRSEETSTRAESVLATPVSRRQWAASHLTLAFGGSVILLGVAGLGTALTYVAAGGGMNAVSRLAGADLVYAPPIWLMVGLTVALIGMVPRQAPASWAVLAACVVVGFLGAVLRLPEWIVELSPFQRVPELPGAALSATPLLVISAIAIGCTLLGLGALRRRDIGRV